MKGEEIVKALMPWNLWENKLEQGIIREAYIREAISYLKANKVVAILGVRRAGKSFVARQVANRFFKDKKNTLIINFEEVRFGEELDYGFLTKAYDSYLSMLKPDEKPLIILDEIQEVAGWERFVRSLNEKKEAFFVVTGSSAKIMSEELATLLTGRTLPLEVFPLAFAEFLQFKGLIFQDRLDFIRNEEKIKEFLNEYLSFGGFPEIALQQEKSLKVKILNSYYQDILSKDIVKRFNIRRIDKLERVAFYYITNFSSPITFNSIGKFLKLGEKTVEIYSRCIESSKLIFFLRRFSSSLKEQENSPRKVYLRDVGLHNLSNILFSDKVSKIYENIVAIHLLKKYGKDVFYWKDNSGREVDFAVKEGAKVKELIQVCWSIDEIKTKEREIKALLKASSELGCSSLTIITDDKDKEETIDKKRIKYIPLWKYLLHQNKN